jgi:hypothetical protein
MLDDIDYSSLTASETPSEKKKEQGIVSRRIKSEKTSNVAQAKPIDVNAIVEKSQQLSQDLGAPKAAEGLSNYGTEILGGLGALGALAAAHHQYTSSQKKYGETTAGAPPEGMTLKQDMRNIGQLAPVAPPPVMPSLAPETKYSPEIQALIERSEINKAVKAADAAARANPLPVGATPGFPSAANPMDQLTVQPPAPQLMQPKPPMGAVPPAPPLAPPAAPSVGQAVATGGDVTQALTQNLANDLDKANLAQEAKAIEPVAPPQGMKEQYKKSKTNPIGPGGYNYFASQVGPETAPTRWFEQYGEKNVPHAQVQRDYSDTRYPPKPNPTGAKTGGAFGAPKYIPEYIKGGASIGGMVGAAAIPALAAAGVQAYKGNKDAVNAELKDAWNSMKSLVTMPVDVAKAASKGDFGPFKDMLMSMNPGTLLMNEMNKRDEPAIQRMIQAEKVGAGRGIAPPSAYFR